MTIQSIFCNPTTKQTSEAALLVTILDLILTLFVASLRPYCECICHLGHFFLEFCHLGHFFLEYVILFYQIHYDFVCHLVHFFLELVLCWRTLSFLGLL